jgi:hypothetical protein
MVILVKRVHIDLPDKLKLQKIRGNYLQFRCSIGRSQLLNAHPVGKSAFTSLPLFAPLIPAIVPVGI